MANKRRKEKRELKRQPCERAANEQKNHDIFFRMADFR